MPRPTEVEPRDGYVIWIRYSDGAAGLINLSSLAGRGVFAMWRSRAFFEAVLLTENGAVVWGEDIKLCSDARYMRLTGKSVKEVMPKLRTPEAHTELSRFYGITIRMYFDDHQPPYFHATYSGDEAVIRNR